MKRFLAVMLSAIAVFTSVVVLGGCSTVTEKIDDKKTQLYVANYNGGVGEKWLDNAKVRFEQKYANTSFEEGKTGVQIIVNHNKSHDGLNLINSMKTSKYEVFFTGGANYFNYVGNDLLYDVTNLVNNKVNSDDGKKISDKMTSDFKKSLTINNRIYAIPHYELYYGPSYDAGLFASQGLYFLDQLDTADSVYPGTNKIMQSGTDAGAKKSCGPDGEYNTYDDGLPSSMMELYKLINTMVKRSIIPYVWTGASPHYSNQIMRNIFANLGGKGLVDANFDFDSYGKEVEYVSGFDGNKPIIDKTVITKENAYLVRQSAAIYYALEFAYNIRSNNKNYKEGCDEITYEHITAMDDIVFSGLYNTDKIAMIIDGNWWWNEANDAEIFTTLQEESYETYAQKDFKVMPMPVQYEGRVTEGNGSAPVIISTGDSFCFVNKNIDSAHVKVMEEFISFLYSQNELLEFTKATNGILKCVNYEYKSIKKDLNTFANSSLEIIEASKNAGNYRAGISNDTTYLSNMATFSISNNSWLAISSTDMFPFYYLKAGSTLADVKTNFNKLAISENTWLTQYVK